MTPAYFPEYDAAYDRLVLAVLLPLEAEHQLPLFKDGEDSTIFRIEREHEPNYTRSVPPQFSHL